MRSSQFLRFLIPITAVVALVLWTVNRQIESSRMQELRQTEEKYVALLGEALADDFRAVVTDLLVLAYDGELQRALNPADAPDFSQAAAAFQRFAERKKVYDQIRFLDATGQEVVRINYRDGSASVVASDQLQSKRDRYYFSETMRLPRDRVFVSAFDLNVEDGRIEQPLKPTIRFGTPIFDAQGTRRGMLVLNYLGRMVLNRFARLDEASPGQAMLLNSDGYWLYDAVGERQWGFMFPERGGPRFGQVYGDAWQQMSAPNSGQFRSPAGLFTFETVYPFRGVQSLDETADNASISFDRRWHVVSLVSAQAISQHLADLRRVMGLLSLLLLGVVVGISWLLARYASARESSEQALRQSELRFRQMAEAIAEVFWMSTTDRFHLLYVSPAFQSIWQCEDLSLAATGQSWRASIHPDDRDPALQVLDHMADCDEFSVQYRVTRSSGDPRWIWDQGFAVRDNDGNIVGYAGIAEDITVLKEAQEKSLRSERLAAIGEAITGLAHESRNALQRSQSCLEMLAKRVTHHPEAAGLVTRIQDALRDLNYLYERVRNYAAPLRIDTSPHDLQLLWQQVCDEMADDISRRGAVITPSVEPVDRAVHSVAGVEPRETPETSSRVARVEPGETPETSSRVARAKPGETPESRPVIPPEITRLNAHLARPQLTARRETSTRPDTVCEVDSHAMRQVFRNILENALSEDLDAVVQRDQVNVQVTWSEGVSEPVPAIEMRVRDNGPGFDGASQRIFEPFFTTKTRGTGLGMAISRRIIEAHGGSIDATSSPGCGLEIRIVLPRAQA